MIDSGEHDPPPSPLELAIDLRNAIDACDTERYPNGCMADLWRMADRLVNALTPPPAALAPTAHEPIDWSDAANG